MSPINKPVSHSIPGDSGRAYQYPDLVRPNPVEADPENLRYHSTAGEGKYWQEANLDPGTQPP